MITVLLSWYDEDPAWLDRMIRSLEPLHPHHLIALDGAYALYPDGKAASPSDQADAIRQACRDIGTTLTLQTPMVTWQGMEIEKRNYLFWLAEKVTDPSDWYMVIDADEVVTHCPPTMPAMLDTTPFDVASVDLRELGHAFGTVNFPTFPMFYRAIRGLHVHTNHFTYTTPDGRNLWGDAKRCRLEPRATTDMVVEHHCHLRPSPRRLKAMDYYHQRDTLELENIRPNRPLLETA